MNEMTNDIQFDQWITNSVQWLLNCHGLHAAHFPSSVADATLFKTVLIIFCRCTTDYRIPPTIKLQ